MSDTETDPLFVAIEKNDAEEVVSCILGLAMDPNMLCHGFTALTKAVYLGYLEVASKLIENGADINMKDLRDISPLQLATIKGHVTLTQMLVDRGASVDVQDIHRRTPLHLAAWNGHVAIVNKLLDHGADPNVADHEGETPFRNAVHRGFVEVVKLFLPRMTRVNGKRGDGRTCLHISAGKSDVEMVKVLLRHGANANVQDHNGKTPLHAAINCINTTRYVLTMENVNVVDHNGNTAADLATNPRIQDFLLTIMAEWSTTKVLKNMESEKLEKLITEKEQKLKIVNKKIKVLEQMTRQKAIMEKQLETLYKQREILKCKQQQESAAVHSLEPATSMERTLECPICMEIPRAPKQVFQCRNGHTYCNTCRESIIHCAICRVPIRNNDVRSLITEKIIVDLPSLNK